MSDTEISANECKELQCKPEGVYRFIILKMDICTSGMSDRQCVCVKCFSH